uniref:Nudix hydrolase domain-containing protein n=1 Tax=Tetradesmus obliquus TaxID=3088 RepID=A0A383V9A4_TETOB|eukprot:jgi/Sobl393_1/13752/SZX61751.1
MAGSLAMRAVQSSAASQEDFYKHGMRSLSPDSPVSHVLEGLCHFREQPLTSPSQFVRPTSLLFQQAGRERRWDAVQAHESVAAMLHNSQLDAFIVVRQFRPAIYAVRWRAAKAAGLPEPPPAAGLSYELCAGILDKPGKSAEQVCCEEILEEVGYRVSPQQLACCAGSVISSAGVTGAPQAVFFAQVDESMRARAGGGTMAASERVEALSLPVAAVDAFIADASLAKTPGLCFGLLWGRQWLQQQQQQQQQQSSQRT